MKTKVYLKNLTPLRGIVASFTEVFLMEHQYGFVRCLAGFVLGMATYLAFRIDLAKKYLANVWVLLIERSNWCFLMPSFQL
jgi:hypothetical protein